MLSFSLSAEKDASSKGPSSYKLKINMFSCPFFASIGRSSTPIESKNPTAPQRGPLSRPSRPTAEPCPTYPIPIPLSKWAEALRLYDVYTVFRDKEDASQGHSPATSVNDGLVDKSSHSSSLLVSILSGKINTRSTLILSNI